MLHVVFKYILFIYFFSLDIYLLSRPRIFVQFSLVLLTVKFLSFQTASQNTY
jgi:hypothetical protein